MTSRFLGNRVLFEQDTKFPNAPAFFVEMLKQNGCAISDAML
jgi:hypothetical protein